MFDEIKAALEESPFAEFPLVWLDNAGNKNEVILRGDGTFYFPTYKWPIQQER